MNNTSHNAGSKSLTIVRACFSFQLCYFVHSLHALLGGESCIYSVAALHERARALDLRDEVFLKF